MSAKPFTELDAINRMLATIGEAPVSTLNGDLTTDVIMAKNTLTHVSRDIQSHGWHFNTEVDVPLHPNEKQEIVLPPNCLLVDGAVGHNYIDRGGKLYDKDKRSGEFNDTAFVVLVTEYVFNDLPYAAKQYITIRAARIFHDQLVGGTTLHGFTQADEEHALNHLLASEGESADYNLFNNASTQAILRRN